jgi:ribokinase
MSDVAVIGSLNMDLVVRVARTPQPGETIAGSSFSMIPGGKGANQAAAASKMGADTLMIGCVGDDPFGRALADSLAESGVALRHVAFCPDVSTGTATIIVEEDGENRIIIVPGANGKMSAARIDGLADAIAGAKIAVLQHEVPLEVNTRVVEIAHESAVRVMLNPAPAYPLPDRLLRMVDLLVVNEIEARALADHAVDGVESALEAAVKLHERGAGTIIVTLGAQGAVVLSERGRFHVPALPVEVVDSTAAGDSFVGGLAAALVRGDDLEKAVTYAVAAGGLAVTRLGAQPSIPTHEDVIGHLARLSINRL